MKKVRIVMLLTALVIPLITNAQTLREYDFSYGTGTYTSIATTGTVLPATINNSYDDDFFEVRLPFELKFGRSIIPRGTSIYPSTNGFIAIGDHPGGTSQSYNGSYRVINPLVNSDMDMSVRGDYDPQAKVIVGYELTGNDTTSMTIEYVNLHTYSAAAASSKFNYQVVIYSNGNILINIGPTVIGTSNNRSQFIVDGPKNDMVGLGNSWTSPRKVVSTPYSNSTTYPPAGSWYKYERPVRNCAPVENIVMSDLDTNQFRITWNINQQANGYIVSYSRTEMEFTGIIDTSFFIRDTSVLLTNLRSGTVYFTSVQAVCTDTAFKTYSKLKYVPKAPLPASALPWHEGGDFNDALKDCYKQYFLANQRIDWTSYPQLTTGFYNGRRSLYFYGSPTVFCYMVLPSFETAVSNLHMHFKALRNQNANENGRLYIGVMTDPSDTSTFQLLRTIQCTKISEWEDFDIDFSQYNGQGKYIAIFASHTAYDYTYVDDLVIYEPTTCEEVEFIHPEFVYSNTAQYSWTLPTGSTSSSYLVYFASGSANLDSIQPITVYDTTVIFNNLQPGSLYHFRVAPSCTNGQNGIGMDEYWFRTAIDTVMAVPYTQNFDGIQGSTGTSTAYFVDRMAGWYGGYTYRATYYPSVYTGNNLYVSSPNALRLYGFKTNKYQSFAQLPRFSTPIDSLTLRFDLIHWYQNGYDARVIVGVSREQGSLICFDTVETFDISSQALSYHQSVEVDFRNYDGLGSYITIIAPPAISAANYYNQPLIDNVMVDIIPACPGITNVNDTGRTDTQTTLVWNDNGSGEYLVALSLTNNFNPDTCQATSTYLPYLQLMGLTPYTTYYVRVRGVCGADSSRWSGQYTFSTPFGCGDSRHYFVEPSFGTGTNAYNYPLYANNTTYPWARSIARWSRSELKRMGVHGDNHIRSIQIYNNTSNTNMYINKFKIYMSEVNDSVFTANTDTMSFADMQLVYSSTRETLTTGWNEFFLDSLFFYSGSGHLQVALVREGTVGRAMNFRHTNISRYSMQYGYKSSATANRSCSWAQFRYNAMFKVCTVNPQCETVDSLQLRSIGDSSVTISFAVNPSANYYEVVATSIHGNPDSVDATYVQTASNSPYTFTGLEPNKQYKLWIRQMCSSGDTSTWRMVQFRTSCTKYDLPYHMDFNSLTGGSNGSATTRNVPCWLTYNQSSGIWPYVYNGYSSTRGNCLRFYSTSNRANYAVLPLMNDTITNMQVSFDNYKSSASYGMLFVGVMSDPDDLSTFTPIDTINSQDVGWTRQVVTFNNYTGTGNRIAFVVKSSYTNYVYIDNVDVEQIASCLRPNHFSLTNVDTSSATLTWRCESTSPLGYEVAYGPHGFTIGDTNTLYAAASSETVTLNNLRPAKYYDVYARTICGMGDTSVWSAYYLFATDCVPTDTLPLVYGFENMGTGTNALVPPCYNRYNDAPDLPYSFYPYVSGTANTGVNSLYFYSSTSTNYANKQFYSLPIIDTTISPMNTLQVSFYAKVSSYSYIGSKIIAGTISDPNDIRTFHPCDTFALSLTYERYFFYPTRGNRVAFMMVRGSSVQLAYLDDVRIEVMPTCRIPVRLALSNETAHTIDVDWGTNSSNGPWQVAYTYTAPGNAQGSDTVVATTPHVTLTNLPVNASVSVRVRSTCGGNDSSEWTLPKMANTEMCENATGTNLFSGNVPTVANSSNFIQTCYRYSWSQTIVRASELQNMGGISAIKFYVFDTTGSSANRKVEIFIGHTTKSTFSSTSDWERTAVDGNSNYHKYYDGRLTYTSGWNTIELDSAFTWNGTSNIIIAVRRIHGAYRCSGSFGQEDVSNPNMCILRYSDTYADSTKTFADVAAASTRPARPAFRLVYCNVVTCAQPLVSSVTTTHNSATATWTGSATNYEVALRQADVATWPAATIVSALTHTFSGLTANTQYVVRVRAVCDVDDTSSWTEYPFTTADLPCGTPTNLAATTSFTTATLDWNAGINETEWQLHVWNTTSDTVYDVSSKPTTLSGMPQASSYFASVRAVCSLADSIFSEYSDTISFTTDSCAQVSNVQVTPDSISAVVSWSAGSNHVNRYEVTYGLLGFVDGEGTTIQTTTTEATITGLLPETSYDVTVRGFCTETEAGQWTDMVRFRTLASPEPVAINSVDAATSLTIYPNPANNSTTLSIEGIDGKVVIAIVDLNGRTVRTLTAFCNSGCTTNIDLADLAEGVYMVSATSGSAKAVRRLVVRH